MAIQATIILGILTITSLFITIFFGMRITKGKQGIKQHKFFAFLTAILALIHAALVIYRYYF